MFGNRLTKSAAIKWNLTESVAIFPAGAHHAGTVRLRLNFLKELEVSIVRIGKFLALGAIAGTMSMTAYSQTPDSAPARPNFVPSELLVRFADDASPAQVSEALSSVRAQVVRAFPRLSMRHIRVAADRLREARERLELLSIVEYAEPNYYRYIEATPNDTRFSELWGMENTGQTGGLPDADIDATEAWDIETGDQSVVVAVIDSGIDIDHPDLVDNLWINPGEIQGNGIDDDGNGFVDDIIGWDFADGDNNPDDSTLACASHGIHTSGTVGARGNNGTGVAGVNWNVQIMSLRAFQPFLGIFCSGNDADIIAAINYAADKGVRVSNNSYGGGPFSQAVFDAIQASDSVFVAAAGNDGTSNDAIPHYPSNYALSGIISVAASDDADQLASFSNFGVQTVDLAAPGVDILSTIQNGNYGLLSGTSMASPHVAGAAALLMANDPTLTNKEVIWRVINSTDFTGVPVASGGRLNLNNMLSMPPSTVVVDLVADGPMVISPGDSVPFTVNVTNLDGAQKSARVRVIATFPNGREAVILDRNVNLAPFFSGGQSFSRTLPAGAATGDYVLAATVEVVSESFDEDRESYTVVP